jgi:hypothetical protein
MPRAVLLLAASSALLGCAVLRPPPSDPSSEFSLRTRWFNTRARLDGNQLVGRGVDVVHIDDGYRGWTGGRPVNLSARGNRLVGLVGEQVTELQVEPLPGGFRIGGSFGGDPGAITLTGDVLVGRIGMCVYDFRRSGSDGTWFVSRPARRDHSWVQLSVPSQLGARPLADRAAMLAFFLMHTCGRPGTTVANPYT